MIRITFLNESLLLFVVSLLFIPKKENKKLQLSVFYDLVLSITFITWIILSFVVTIILALEEFFGKKTNKIRVVEVPRTTANKIQSYERRLLGLHHFELSPKSKKNSMRKLS